VQRLVHEPAAAEALRSAARRAAEQFRWEAIAQRHLALYADLPIPKAAHGRT
jgi:glycosyltransferase involved in cell wall biosynthesis